MPSLLLRVITNPLYGEQGAAHVFAPQKGADSAMVERLDWGLRNFAEVVKRHNGVDIASLAGAGAAGGLGGGFVAMLNARLESGIDMVLEAIRFDDIIKGCDLVITGEGRIDNQTLMGKAPSGVLRRAQMQGIPVVAIGGAVVECDALKQCGFAAIIPVENGGVSLQEAMRPDVAARNIERTAAAIAQKLIGIYNQSGYRIDGSYRSKKKSRSSEVFDTRASTAPCLSNLCATETHLVGYNLPIASTNLKLLT